MSCLHPRRIALDPFRSAVNNKIISLAFLSSHTPAPSLPLRHKESLFSLSGFLFLPAVVVPLLLLSPPSGYRPTPLLFSFLSRCHPVVIFILLHSCCHQ
ncbi:hypothetical protein EDD21DRAFT_387533 [Dissophora ornata]|nr:hypothetical protein EDD21DRAFT_387533 [Dissophora ornata]